MAASTVRDFTYSLADYMEIGDGTHPKVHVELRKNGAKFWARATPSNVNAGGLTSIGTLKLETREQTVATGNWGSWTTRKSKSVAPSGQQWTDDSYEPPKSTGTYNIQVRATLTSSPESGDPATQSTSPGYPN